jgi:hypothetical protein
MIRSAEKKIDLMSDFENAMRGHAGTFDLELSMIERGVKIREILSKPKREYTLPSYFLALQKKKPAYEVKFLSFPPTATALIMDNQEILMSTIPETSLLNQPFLSTTNPVLVRTFQQFYDMLWKSSK